MVQEFNQVLNIGSETKPQGAAREALKARAADVVRRLEESTPPSGEWRELVADYAELMEIHLNHFGEVLPEDAQRRFADINARADERREALRGMYRE